MNNQLSALKIARRRYARIINVTSAVKKMDADPKVKVLLKAFDGSTKELLQKLKSIPKGTASTESLLTKILGKSPLSSNSDGIQNQVNDSGEDAPIKIEMPVNIECRKPEDPNKESVVVMDNDGMVGCGVINKEHLR